MVVCKYFSQGYCKYGKACRFDHVKPTRKLWEYDEEEELYYEELSKRESKQTGSENPYKWVSPLLRKNKSPADSSSQNIRERNESGESSRVESRLSSRSGSRADSFDYGSSSKQTDKYHWVSPMSRKTVNDPESREEPSSRKKMILEDIVVWEMALGKPISAYGCAAQKSMFGFFDVSREELRVEYLAAKERGTIKQFEKNIAELKLAYEEHMKRVVAVLTRNGSPTDDKLNFLKALEQKLPKLFSDGKLNLRLSGTEKSSGAEKTSESFSFKVDAPKQKSPGTKTIFGGGFGSAFSQASSNKQNVASASISATETTEDSTYSKRSELCKEDISAFKAKEFHLGLIPVLPPPKEFCR